MTEVEVVALFKVKAGGQEITLHPEQRVKLKDEIAERLISEGRVKRAKMSPVKIYSRLFNEEIYIVADQEEMETLVSKGVKEVVYMAWEIPLLKGMDKEKLTAIYSVKKIFPGAGLVC
jgi:hypothetical protein